MRLRDPVGGSLDGGDWWRCDCGRGLSRWPREMTIDYGSGTYVAGDLAATQSCLVHRAARLELLEVTGPAGYDTEVVP